MKLFFLKTIFTLALLPLGVSAASLKVDAVALKLISSDIAYGGCYATLSKKVAGICNSTVVSFDCDGVYNKNGAGNRHYSTALLAFSLNKTVNLVVDDVNLTKQGKYCTVTRISIAQ